LLVRLDEEALAKFLSRSAFRVLKKMDPKLVHLNALVKLIDEKVSKAEILRDSEKRRILFDVMRPNETTQLLHALKKNESDNPAWFLINIKFRKNSKNEQNLFEYFETAVPIEDTAKYENVSNMDGPDHGLFNHQYEAMQEIEKYLDEDHRALLHMPTGAGKTRTAMRIVASHMLKSKSALIIWLAYNEELCEQALEEFRKTWKSVGDRYNVKSIRFFGNRNPDILAATKKHDGTLLVAGLLKVFNAVKKRPSLLATLSDRTFLVVFDEAHQAVAPTYKLVLEQLVEKNDKVRLLGLSATPGRTSNSEELAKFFRHRKATIPHSNPVKFLIENRYLAKPDMKTLPYSMRDLTSRETKDIAERLDIPLEILKELAADEVRNMIIIEEIENLITEKHKRIIVFGATVANAKDIAIILSARHHTAYYITNDTPPDIRKRCLDDFLDNDDSSTKILCNFGVLTMGFDAPKTSAVVIARPTKSLVLYSQMIGRAIRGPRAGGTSKCSIRTVVDSSLKSVSVYDAFLNWENIWE